MDTPTFVVHGYIVSAEVQAALIAKMKAGPFRASAIEAEAERQGLPRLTEDRKPVAMRVADRIIQRERGAGNIELRRPLWVWVAGSGSSDRQAQQDEVGALDKSFFDKATLAKPGEDLIEVVERAFGPGEKAPGVDEPK